ncbi:D-aminoacylase [Rhodococcus sp. BP-252]|uniref:N-acyl-D-amino-acid deacylase n=1 Tax=Rhodococcoides kyotonense TaxID=398843 RepID=A0A177YE80_9NOCA|nr:MULTISPECIES: D-aminoacylase [Rhodococcus]MBY6414039.1 D-aminoacylase [Rhodococcus sp. BP-320]MBY6418810.1 D-aminoacylase [Rhodococcus sp. BP-321]MBY6423445.1 D-aminoacylase [Rhodococcus sp. BP-324]MBY6428899.1 D-aminoacylase [Rhodococcus sp. BP-323]MBY6433905.1 D-aminoacylase [Rhodococcus sp. BP-322]
MTELLIRGADVVDGTGAPRTRRDVLVKNGRIESVTAPGLLDGADRIIDVPPGHVLSPGFIDMHAHSDLGLLTDPGHFPKISQGVTTEVIGQDGIAYAPIDDATLDIVRRQIAGWNGNPSDLDFSWRSVAEYLARLDRGITPNAAYLVPQGTLRYLAVGGDQRPATARETAHMRELLAQGLAEGAVGMSSGLTYTPGMYADTSELRALCEVVAEFGGFYAPHTRSYGAGALEAYKEMLDLARETGCALHLTHATMNFGVNRGRAGEFLAMVDAAIADGCDVTLDTYPYLPGATTLSALLPSWAMSGGPDQALARMDDPEMRARIAEDVDVNGSDGCHGVTVEWETIQLSGVANPELDRYVGRTMIDIAADRGEAPVDVFFDILQKDQLATTILQHVGHEDNVRAIMAHPHHMGGSDAILVGERPHPRAWGTFPRYLGHYVREERLLGLEDCINHLTGRPAGRLGLSDRGTIAEGNAADLVLFDPATVSDTATFEKPKQQAVGISHVIVNGALAIDDGQPTGNLAGHSLRRMT